jgi:hypothetical protein
VLMLQVAVLCHQHALTSASQQLHVRLRAGNVFAYVAAVYPPPCAPVPCLPAPSSRPCVVCRWLRPPPPPPPPRPGPQPWPAQQQDQSEGGHLCTTAGRQAGRHEPELKAECQLHGATAYRSCCMHTEHVCVLPERAAAEGCMRGFPANPTAAYLTCRHLLLMLVDQLWKAD